MNCYIHPQSYATRVDMLSVIPTGARIAEIGVFEGDFSKELLDHVRPRQLVLIDLWSPGTIWSGDVDGNAQRAVEGKQLEQGVRQRFSGRQGVEILRGTSRLLRNYPESYFDAIYIDAAHEYFAVLGDLAEAFRVVKPGGWLMGHDYGINAEKTEARWEFGVRAAVDGFCEDFGERIACFALDGCTSFGIQLRKLPTLYGRSRFRGRVATARMSEAFGRALRCCLRRS